MFLSLIFLQPDILDLKISCLTVDALCDLLDNIQDLNPNQIPHYKEIIKENNITGRVLLHCDLQELKNVSFIRHFCLAIKRI